MKPHDPGAVTFARQIAAVDTVSGVNLALIETDREVENVKLTVEGEDLSVAAVEDAVTDLGGTIHSVDEVACGERLIEERRTPQDT
jgi:hypothetical protein